MTQETVGRYVAAIAMLCIVLMCDAVMATLFVTGQALPIPVTAVSSLALFGMVMTVGRVVFEHER